MAAYVSEVAIDAALLDVPYIRTPARVASSSQSSQVGSDAVEGDDIQLVEAGKTGSAYKNVSV